MFKSTSSGAALAVAVLALVVAVGGTVSAHPALAARVLTKAKVAKIANKQVTKRATTLTVNNANKLAGTPASSYALASDFAAMSTSSSSCDPTNSTFLNCMSLQVKLDRPSKLLLIAETPFGDDSNDGATGVCQLLLDGAVLPATIIRVGIGGVTGGSSDADNTGMGVTNVTAPAAAGVHIVTLQCNQLTPDLDFNDLSMSAVGIPV